MFWLIRQPMSQAVAIGLGTTSTASDPLRQFYRVVLAVSGSSDTVKVRFHTVCKISEHSARLRFQ